jgi:hypothetical protein
MRRALVAGVAIVMLLAPLLSSAAANDGPSRRRPDRQPSARIQAAGSGLIAVAGRLSVNGLIPGRGLVAVRDRRGDARAYLAGSPLELRRGRVTRVRRATGVLYVTGSSVTVTVVGDDLSFSIAGSGRARFDGDGVYTINSGAETAWSGDWVRIAPSSRSRTRRARQCANCSSSVARRR